MILAALTDGGAAITTGPWFDMSLPNAGAAGVSTSSPVVALPNPSPAGEYSSEKKWSCHTMSRKSHPLTSCHAMPRHATPCHDVMPCHGIDGKINICPLFLEIHSSRFVVKPEGVRAIFFSLLKLSVYPIFKCGLNEQWTPEGRLNPQPRQFVHWR